MSKLASDGSWNITYVDGTTRTGLFAPNGSFYVVDQTANEDYVGIMHPCGAMNVVTIEAGDIGMYAPNGALQITSNSDYSSGAQRTTDVTPP